MVGKSNVQLRMLSSSHDFRRIGIILFLFRVFSLLALLVVDVPNVEVTSDIHYGLDCR